MAKKPLIYTPFNSSMSEKLEIVDFSIKRSSEDDGYILLYKLKKEMDNGDIVSFYKASKFFRLVRVARVARGETKMMEIQSDILRGLYTSQINFVQIIANILESKQEDTPSGLLFLYGTQSIGATKDEALRKANNDFNALLRSFQGTHRTAHVQFPEKKEIDWVFRKLQYQKYITVVKGIPQAKSGSGMTKNRMTQIETATEEQLEQFISGMISQEFLLMLMATPIDQFVLRSWLTRSLKEQTKWEGQKQGSNSLSAGVAVPLGLNMSTGESAGTSIGQSDSVGSSYGESWGQSESLSQSESQGSSFSESLSVSEGVSTSEGTNVGYSEGTSTGQSFGESGGTGRSSQVGGSANFLKVATATFNVGNSVNSGWSTGSNVGTSSGTNFGSSTSTGTSESVSTGQSWGETRGTSQSQSVGSSLGGSRGSNVGQSTSQGANVGTSRGLGSSLGLAPNVSVGKTYQFIDVTVQYITELLTIQNQRLKDSTEGEGAFFVDLYISTNDEKSQRSVQSMATSTWVHPDSKIDVLRAIVPSPNEQKRLSVHMQALSPCLDMERNRVGKFYKYSSILRSAEIAAYSHPPRISTGGLDNAMHDRPMLRVPNNRQTNEIFIGNVVNGERYNIDQAHKYDLNGYMTDYKFGISKDELHHAFISGQAGSGKSVLAWRLVSELYNNTYNVHKTNKKKKRKRILILDPKGEWRLIGNVIPPGKFKFKSLSDPSFHPVHMNILRVPKYIRAYDYYQMVVEMFCYAYGLYDRALAQIGSIIYDLYESAGAFESDDPSHAHEATKDITMEDVYDNIGKERKRAQENRENHNAEALLTYQTRLDAFKKKKSKEYIMFCNRGGESIEELLGEDEVTVLESNGLSKQAQGFFFTLAMASIFKYAQGVKGFYRAPDQYETFIVLEEANAVLIGEGRDGGADQGIRRFEELIDQSRSFGLFVWVITQKIASMPDSVIANSGMIFAGKTTRQEDVSIVVSTVGMDERYEEDGRALKKFLPKMPVGEFVVKISKSKLEIDQESTLVKVAPLELEVPTDEELDVIIQENEIERMSLK